jgi:hypothetical protein
MAQNPFHYEGLDHLKRCRDVLSPGAKETLGAACHIATTAPLGGQGQFRVEDLKRKLSKYDSLLLMSFVKELESRNLLWVQNAAIPGPDYMGVLLNVTPLGRQFVTHSNAGNI